MGKLRAFVSSLPTPVYLVAILAAFGAATFLVRLLVDGGRLLIPYRSLRLGSTLFPADPSFVVGVILLFVCFELITRLIARDCVHYGFRRVGTFIIFALSFRSLFVMPLSLPRPAHILPFQDQRGACRIYTRLQSAIVGDQLLVCAAFTTFFSQTFFQLPEDLRLNILLFSSSAEYQEGLSKLGHDGNPLGAYVHGIEALFVHPETGLGTLTHELTHAFLRVLPRNPPPWAEEGVPVFFEKFFAARVEGGLGMKFGFVNPWRLRELATRLPTIRWQEIVLPRERKDSTESGDGLISYFLWHEGKFVPLLRLLRSGSAASESILENLFPDRAEVERRWQGFLTVLIENSERWETTPTSAILPSVEEVDAMFRLHALSQPLSENRKPPDAR